MRPGRPRLLAACAALTALVMLTSGCAQVVDGTPSLGLAPNANLVVIGDAHTTFDTVVKNALSDVTNFWQTSYPKIASGAALPKLKGGLFSINGDDVARNGSISGPAAKNGCLKGDHASDIVDNAFYCESDDSIVWDRSGDHLLAAIGKQAGAAGPLVVAMAFAHEFGHAIQARLGIFNRNLPTIDTESQADCAAGAWTAAVLKNQAAHFRATPETLAGALNAYLLVRDKTPTSSQAISHGNGFDRLSALNDGITHGVTYCYSSTYFDRQFTERPFVTDADYASGGNETLAEVLNAAVPTKTNDAGGLQPDLNRFWTAAGKSINKTFQPVKIAEAPTPKCGSPAGAKFGYCPDDNTVYYDQAYAQQAYNSLQSLNVDPSTSVVTILKNQPADYALGTLFAMGWGMAVRHQLFGESLDGKDALLAAACYTGAYSKDINLAQQDAAHQFTLSPPDMDEATSAMINLVAQDSAFGARGTQALDRIQAFVKGYNGGLSVC